MGVMKDFLITIHNGGDEAVAAVQRVSEDWRAQLEQAAAEVESLRPTDAEREAIARAVDIFEVHPRLADEGKAATLRGLLGRLGHR